MCVVSMIMDDYRERWAPLVPLQPAPVQIFPFVQPVPMVTQKEVDEFRKLLARAREYDKKHNEPDCELDEKRQALKQIAKELGIDISFVDSEQAPQDDPVERA